MNIFVIASLLASTAQADEAAFSIQLAPSKPPVLQIYHALYNGGDDSKVRLYRGLTPHFVANDKSLIETTTGSGQHPGDFFKGLKEGTVVYFKAIQEKSDGLKIALTPLGLNPVKSKDALSLTVTVPYKPLEVVFIGDSITEAGYLSSDQTPCAVCAEALELGPKSRPIVYSNQGHSGHTTKDYLPGGSDMAGAEDAARKLERENHGELIFSIMLGTNDSANSGTNGAPASAETYGKNLRATVAQLLKDFPKSRVVLQRPTWYSANTHNGSNYEETGLERLTTYFPVLAKLTRAFPKGKVFLGDERGYDYFAATYLTNLNIENGQNGTFYLHPNTPGAKALGYLWAQGILKNLDR